MTGVIRTVLGDIDSQELGRTDYHEHLFQSSPLLTGDDLDDLELSAQETVRFQRSGFDALIDLTPIGLGRRPGWLTEVSRRTGVHIVAATGVHRPEHYLADHEVHTWSVETMIDRFVAEITDGSATESGEPSEGGPRAGVIKVGTGYWEISALSQRVLEAAAVAHQRTGASVVCHLELGTAAWEVAEVLERNGLPREHLVLAHVDRNPDPGLHTELAASGVYLGYDGAARAKYWPDSVLIECLVKVAENGGADRLLLGGDVARRSSFTAYGGMPGMAYLGERFVPRLRAHGGEALVRRVLVTNPAEAFALAEIPEVGP